jgi:subtilase family serine protease
LAVFSSLCFAVQPDRISAIDSSQAVRLKGNVHGLARPGFDQGRLDGSRLLSGVSLVFKPSAAQQADLNGLLVQQQDRSSPNYHKWLTPAQFADRFGMSRSDVQKVTSWLQSQGLTVTRVANSRNQVFFQGKVAQIEAAFRTEMHNYLVNGEMHFANATEPSVPAALSGMTIGLQDLHNFLPKPHAKMRVVPTAGVSPHFTSHISGNHFLAPADFATIYDVQAFYGAGFDGAGQKIAVIGQSAVSLTDIHNFRTAAGLATNDPTTVLVPGTGASTICGGDEGESDLDLEWTGGIAKNATIVFVYTGPGTGADCNHRTAGAFNALQYAVDQNLAPIISNSYGNCEANIGSANAVAIQGWAKQANTQGQTIFSASGDSGAADCDFQVTTAVLGLAVDIPAAIPEVTGVGGTEFDPTVDVAGTLSGTPPNTNASATAYWSGTTNFLDKLPSALSYIPEVAWNDTALDLAHGGKISASGGGASIYFPKPYWQAATGVPGDNVRDVPDISISGSADHDGYLYCSEDGATVQTCANGFRDASAPPNLTVVGGTSAGPPAMAGVMALFNQSMSILSPNGWGNLNPLLYELVESYPGAFNDITSGNNIVPCTSGTPNCTGGQLGFGASSGYDQVTGLGSINAFALAQDTVAPDFDFVPDVNSVSITQGQTATVNFTITPVNGFTGTLNFSSTNCSGLPSEATCTFSPSSISVTGTAATTVTLTIKTTAPRAELIDPLGRNRGVFYAVLLPGLLGMFAVSLPRKSRAQGISALNLLALLAISTLWMGACGGGSSNKDPGTPKGTYTVVVMATTGGSAPITTKANVLLTVN